MTQNLARHLESVLNEGKAKWDDTESVDQLIEEMGELLVALQQFKRSRVSNKDVLEELVDVSIMTEVIMDRQIFGSKTEYYDMVSTKLFKMHNLTVKKSQ